jgi:hypothetical protein
MSSLQGLQNSGLDGKWNDKRLGLLGSTTYKNGAATIFRIGNERHLID